MSDSNSQTIDPNDAWLLACREGEARTFHVSPDSPDNSNDVTWTIDRRPLNVVFGNGASTTQVVVTDRAVSVNGANTVLEVEDDRLVAAFKVLQALAPDPSDSFVYREYQESVRKLVDKL